MIHRLFRQSSTVVALLGALTLALPGCGRKDGGDTAPPPARVVEVPDMNLITIDSRDVPKFPLAAAGQIEAPSELRVTGTVSPDISREVPVISLANGRVVDIRARLNDNVRKGQLLFSVQSPDVSAAFAAYTKAVAAERVAAKAYERARDLYDHGATALSMVEQAEGAEKQAQADLAAAVEQLRILGVDKDHPSSIVPVYAPISGVIIAQNVTNAAAAGVSLSGSATAFTVADLSTVWILCDVYENDIPRLQVGQRAEIRLEAYPDRTLTGRVSDIGPVLDPSLRTAKVRIQVPNPGILRLGMFVTATFSSLHKERHTVVPADAVLHLHDRDWVYVPAGESRFRRTEVRTGRMIDDNRQQIILSGIEPGQQVVTRALLLETAGNQ